MTGFESKRQAAQAKLNDEADTLTIVYQRGFADGKRSAERKPLTDEQDRALCEAYCNDASDEYFKARPALDFPEMHRIFYAGYRKAWPRRGHD